MIVYAYDRVCLKVGVMELLESDTDSDSQWQKSEIDLIHYSTIAGGLSPVVRSSALGGCVLVVATLSTDRMIDGASVT